MKLTCQVDRCPNAKSTERLCAAHNAGWLGSLEYPRHLATQGKPGAHVAFADFVWRTQREELRARGKVMTREEVWAGVKRGEISPMGVE